MLHGSSDRLAEIDQAFDEALSLDPDGRRAFLASVAARDPTLAADVERLLRASDDHDPPIDFSRWVAQAWRTLGDTQDDAPEPAVPAGTLFGAYRVVREVARGGMATVYLAERDDGAFEQQVALKVLPLAFADREAQQRLHRERGILARLQHPNICRLLDGGADQWGRPFLVMEFVDGAAIDAFCEANRLTIDRRIRLVVAVAEAVASAHRSLIVHGDLKPSNILVTPDGRVTLLDFGIARLLDPGEADGTTARRLMTPGWASPEQLRGDPLSTASDVFQLGLLLRTLLAGRPAERVQGSGRLRGDLDTIVSKALEADPGARYDSATALADDLDRHLDGRPILARPQTLAYRTSRFVRRHRVGAAVGALAVAGITAGAGTAAYQSVVASRERAAAQHAAAQAARVSDFLVEVFEVSAPERALGSAITARELLDRGVQRIEQLHAEPALKASLLATMARAYRSHGSYDRAAALFERALAERRAATPAEPDALATALHDLGTVRHYQTDFKGAFALLDEALALWQASGGPNDPSLADTLHQRGRVRLAMNDHRRAEEDLRGALDMLRRLRGNGDPSVASVLVDLGQLLGHGRRAADATPLLEEAVDIRRTVLGSRHPAYSESLMALGTNLDARGRETEALRLVREAAEIAKAVYGSDHPATLNRENALAARLFNQGEYEEALTLFRRIHDTSRTRLGDRHPLLGVYGTSLGSTYYEMRRFEDAERALRHALEIYQTTHRPQAPEHLNTIRLLANTLVSLGRHREAEGLFERGLAASRHAPKAADEVVAALQLGYGRLLIVTGRHHRAAPLVEAGYATVRVRRGESTWRTAAAKTTVGRLRLAQRKPDEAAALWAEALDVLVRDRPKHPITAEVRELLARARR